MSNARRYLTVWIPRLPTERWERREPDLRRQPFALIAKTQGRISLTAINGPAAEGGLTLGLGLADARATVPDLVVKDADPTEDARVLAALADWSIRFTPIVAIADADTLILDVTGCAHLWGGERELMADVVDRLAGFGHRARAALASTPGAAWALSHFSGQDGIIVPESDPDTLDRALAPLSVGALRLDSGTASALERVGLRRIGELIRVPSASLVRRYGQQVVLRVRQAYGHEPEPLTPHRPVPRYRMRLAFAEPLWRVEDVSGVTRRLIDGLCLELAGQLMGARRLELALFHVDGRVDHVPVGTAQPSRSADRLMRLFEHKLFGADADNGIEAMILSAPAVEPLGAVQTGLLDDDEVKGTERLVDLVDRLDNRVGRVLRPTPVESRIPERAVAFQPPFVRMSNAPSSPWPPAIPRPHRLLARPERIEAMAAVPDGPPVAFTWRGTTYRVRAADGPERLTPEWWDPADDERHPRDYYRVEEMAGRRFWVFRHGLFERAEMPTWFLHGFFG